MATVSVGLGAFAYQGYAFAERSLRERDSRDTSLEAICASAREAAFESLESFRPLLDEVDGFAALTADAQESLEAELFERTVPIFTCLQRAVRARTRKRRFFRILGVMRPIAFVSMIVNAAGAGSSVACLALSIPPYPTWAAGVLSLSTFAFITTCCFWSWAELTDMSINRLRVRKKNR